MHFRNAFIAASTVISVVSAITFNVAVGQNDQNVFDPPFLTGIQNGDTIDFQFVSKIRHSVTQSTFDDPCTMKANGVDSGLLTAASPNPEWSTTINDTSEPLWFYCIPHCRLGMVFAINPSAADFATFTAAAKSSTNVTTTAAAPSTSPSNTSSTYTTSDTTISPGAPSAPSSVISPTLTTPDTTSPVALSALSSAILPTFTTPGTTPIPPLTASSAVSPTSTTPSTTSAAITSSLSTTSSSVSPTTKTSSALGQVSVALWLSALSLFIGLAL